MPGRARFVANRAGIGEVMRSAKVRAALRVEAERIASAARRGYTAENVDATVRVSEETRPKGRPTAKVLAEPGAASEFGTSKTQKRRVLGRAAGLE